VQPTQIPEAPHRERLRALVRTRQGAKDLDPGEEQAAVWRQVDRELRVRTLLYELLLDARRFGSVKEAFDRLVWYDDPRDPVLAVEPGQGIVVYRHVDATTAELAELEDSGVRFGADFRGRVVQFAGGELPVFSPHCFVLGDDGEGSFFFRLLRFERAG